MKRLLLAVLLVSSTASAQLDVMCHGEDSTGTVRRSLMDSSGREVVTGALTSNGAAPGATNAGCLGAVANAAAPSYTEGMQVLQSVDLSGNMRVAGSGTFTVAGAKTNDDAAPGATNVGALVCVANAAAPTWTEGNLVAASVDLSGGLRVNKATSTTSAPAATTTTVPADATPCTAVGGASCTIIYPSTDLGAWPNITITLRNSSANVLENVLIEWSPDGTNFELWDSTSLDNLAATTTASIAISGNSRRFLRLEARSDDEVVSAVVNITASQN